MWKKIVGGIVLVIVVVVAVVLGIASMRPDTFRVERSATITAPPARVYALVADFHQWERWSPWEKLDPALKRTYSGADSGVGAAYEWQGNKDVGRGRMDIVEATAPSRIAIALHFIEPFDSTNRATFTFTPDADTTRVVWTMEGREILMSKVMGLFMNMDKMIGGDFERGLANLKAVAERPT